MQIYARLAKALIFNTTPNNYEAVANSWLSALFVIAAILTVGMILYEWLLKRMDGRRHPWGRNKILLLLLVAVFTTGVGVAMVYWFSDDFQTVVTLPGLFVGVLISWLMSAVIFLIGHFIIPDFRRDLYGF
jgi:uncharacterized membrane protein